MTEAPDPQGDATEDEQERWQVLTQLEDWLERPMLVLSFIWLSLVIIDKLPFAPHTDPLVAARMQQRAEAGEDPFAAIQLPSAAIALKQGFGRLIRRRDDRGIVAILDGRIVTRTYGRVFLETLPPNLPRTSTIEQVKRWWIAGAVRS